jgi:hypothetical protein
MKTCPSIPKKNYEVGKKLNMKERESVVVL